MMSKDSPYAEPGQSSGSSEHLARVLFSILHGDLPEKPSDAMLKDDYLGLLWKICSECWEQEPEKRTSMADVVNGLATRGQSHVVALEKLAELEIEWEKLHKEIWVSGASFGATGDVSRGEMDGFDGHVALKALRVRLSGIEQKRVSLSVSNHPLSSFGNAMHRSDCGPSKDFRQGASHLARAATQKHHSAPGILIQQERRLPSSCISLDGKRKCPAVRQGE